jgi:glycosyltransferase involved in cell wall biosynthesis
MHLEATGELSGDTARVVPGPSSSPLVSVIIPCYRQAHFLSDAIESTLRQSYPSVEVLVINDGSPDETRAVAARFSSIRYIEQENSGLSAARNTGLAQSRGEFVVFLDADDRLLPDALRVNAALLSSNPALGFVAGTSDYISQDGAKIQTDPRPWPTGDIYAELLRRNRIRMPGMVMFRKSAFDRVGLFDTTVDACADYDMYLRVSHLFPVAFHDALVAEYRRHGENMSLDAALMLRQLCRVVRRQRPNVRGHAQRSAALEEGLRGMREYYGDQLAERIRQRVRSRTALGSAVADAARLLILHPRGFFTHVVRKTVNSGRKAPPDDKPDGNVVVSRSA